jgi:hypothetical protein
MARSSHGPPSGNSDSATANRSRWNQHLIEVMSSTPLEGEVNLSTVATARTLACGEVFGGNEIIITLHPSR